MPYPGLPRLRSASRFLARSSNRHPVSSPALAQYIVQDIRVLRRNAYYATSSRPISQVSALQNHSTPSWMVMPWTSSGASIRITS